MSVERRFTTAQMDVKSKFAQDVKKLTSAASRLRLHPKKSKGDKEKKEKQLQQQQQQLQKQEETRNDQAKDKCKTSKEEIIPRSGIPIAISSSGKPRLPPDVIAATRVQSEKKWTLFDSLHCLGGYVRSQCQDLPIKPAPQDVASWVTCADRALQLNGWTVNCFLMESHIVFTYMLLEKALNNYSCRTLTDVKELVLMCLYVSYTYNANEISYPLRPFLVKQDRSAFWNKCLQLSLSSSSEMLRLNQDRDYYSSMRSSLRSVGRYCH